MKQQCLCILGRQPALGLAELESLYGAARVRPVGQQAAVLDIDPATVAFERLGGSIKICSVLSVLPTTNWTEAQRLLVKTMPQYLQQSLTGKLQLGLSAYGLSVTTAQLMATAIALKKALRANDRSVRVVPNQGLALNSAQILHNHLTGRSGWELVLVRDGNTMLCARTLQEQNITAYTLRDRGRPKRDARVGMLPPKLAQLITNLASEELVPEADVASSHPKQPATLLDPFCGTGVVLQEALLMGYNVIGTDLEPRMVEYTTTNLSWLKRQLPHSNLQVDLETGDATTLTWPKPINLVATETYLGRPLTTLPTAEVLAQTMTDCNLIIKKFLQNIYGQLSPGTRLCLAVPAWQVRPDVFKQLPLIDQIEDLGYNRVSFTHVRAEALLYYRENQIVGRKLLVITRK